MDKTCVTTSFVKKILHDAQTVRKTTEIVAVEVKEDTFVQSKEGVEIGRTGDYLVTDNGGASAGYIIQGQVFHELYEQVGENRYRRKGTVLAYQMDEPFYIIPTWNEGRPLYSSEKGGYLLIHNEDDFNICSFEDFETTYKSVEA